MPRRPWPIVLLAALHFLGPIGNAILSAILMKVGLFTYLGLLFKHKTLFGLAEFFLLYPIAGIAIYAVKEWSYPVFLGVVATTAVRNYVTWTQYPQMLPIWLLVAIYVLHVSLVSYFLIPPVRAFFYDSKLRWWESKPRFHIETKAKIATADDEKTSPCEIVNISEGGFFIKTSRKLNPGDVVEVEATLINRKLHLKAEVVYRRAQGMKGFGAKFIGLEPQARQMLKNVMKGLKFMGVETRSGQNKWTEDLVGWSKEVIRTGNGLVPKPVTAFPSSADTGPEATA
jgi:hypothetical protein